MSRKHAMRIINSDGNTITELDLVVGDDGHTHVNGILPRNARMGCWLVYGGSKRAAHRAKPTTDTQEKLPFEITRPAPALSLSEIRVFLDDFSAERPSGRLLMGRPYNPLTELAFRGSGPLDDIRLPPVGYIVHGHWPTTRGFLVSAKMLKHGFLFEHRGTSTIYKCMRHLNNKLKDLHPEIGGDQRNMIQDVFRLGNTETLEEGLNKDKDRKPGIPFRDVAEADRNPRVSKDWVFCRKLSREQKHHNWTGPRYVFARTEGARIACVARQRFTYATYPQPSGSTKVLKDNLAMNKSGYEFLVDVFGSTQGEDVEWLARKRGKSMVAVMALGNAMLDKK